MSTISSEEAKRLRKNKRERERWQRMSVEEKRARQERKQQLRIAKRLVDPEKEREMNRLNHLKHKEKRNLYFRQYRARKKLEKLKEVATSKERELMPSTNIDDKSKKTKSINSTRKKPRHRSYATLTKRKIGSKCSTMSILFFVHSHEF